MRRLVFGLAPAGADLGLTIGVVANHSWTCPRRRRRRGAGALLHRIVIEVLAGEKRVASATAAPPSPS